MNATHFFVKSNAKTRYSTRHAHRFSSQSQTRYDRAKKVRCLSFRYTNRLKLTALEGVRNLTYELACSKCEEIEILQAEPFDLTGEVVDFASPDAEN